MNKWLDGHKTKLAGVGGILTALGYFLTTSLADGFQFSDLVTLFGGISAALAVLGLGGKLNKLMEIFNSLKK